MLVVYNIDVILVIGEFVVIGKWGKLSSVLGLLRFKVNSCYGGM